MYRLYETCVLRIKIFMTIDGRNCTSRGEDKKTDEEKMASEGERKRGGRGEGRGVLFDPGPIARVSGPPRSVGVTQVATPIRLIGTNIIIVASSLLSIQIDWCSLTGLRCCDAFKSQDTDRQWCHTYVLYSFLRSENGRKGWKIYFSYINLFEYCIAFYNNNNIFCIIIM